jgi:ferritin-like metal-binding protein YciE
MNDKTNALVPIDEREVVFYGDTLVAVLVPLPDMEMPQVYVPVKPLSDALGLAWSGQYERLQRDEVLSEASRLIRVTRINSQRGNPDSICLPLKYIPGWLFGISATRVKPELRERVIRYQRECYDVLAEAFQEGRFTSEASFEELLQQNTDAVQAYRMLQAMVNLARSQILIEARLDQHDDRLGAHDKRLDEVEAILGDPNRMVTPDQAMQISQAVKAVASEIGKRTKRNEYGGVYGEMYRKFGIAIYKQLPAYKFDRAMEWLTEWYQSLTGATDDELPF